MCTHNNGNEFHLADMGCMQRGVLGVCVCVLVLICAIEYEEHNSIQFNIVAPNKVDSSKCSANFHISIQWLDYYYQFFFNTVRESDNALAIWNVCTQFRIPLFAQNKRLGHSKMTAPSWIFIRLRLIKKKKKWTKEEHGLK